MARLDHQVAVVTGRAAGLGGAIATRFATEGAHAVIADVDRDATERTAAELVTGDGQASAIDLDISNREQVQERIDSLVADLGKVDILVDNAGVTRM